MRQGETTLTLSAGKHRSLLAALAVSAGDVVSFDRLAELVWDGSPPDGARVALRNYVMRIRQSLGAEVSARIITVFPGYVLNAGENEVDLLAFRNLCRHGHAAAQAGNWKQGSAILSRAQRLCRGTPLADVPSQRLRDTCVPHLEEARLLAQETRIECDLHLGRSSQVAAEVSALAAKYPMRERLQALLMHGLHQQGRRADALAAYMRTRRIMIDQLGIEPGSDLQRAHQQILADDHGSRLARYRRVTRARPVTGTLG